MKRTLILSLLISLGIFSQGSEDTIVNYLGNIKVGTPIAYKNLKIFPILALKNLSLQDYITLDQAMTKDWLKIREAGSGEVNFVEVKNCGNKMVFILTGQMLRGAKQDRMLQEDLLIPANSSWIRVPVYCVEHGRWTQVTPEFKSEGLLVPNAVRGKAKNSESQSEVWNEIASSQDKLGVVSGTGTVRANYEDAEVKKAIDEYSDKFKTLPKLSPSTIGVVVVTGDQIIGLDIFANNGLLNRFWDKLIKSYAMDALSGVEGTIHKDDIEELIEALENSNCVSQGTPGLGELIKLETDFGKGSALVYKNALIHLDFFPSADFNDDPELKLDFRRNERLDD